MQVQSPTSGITGVPQLFSTDLYLGDLQWQTATNAGGPWTDVSIGLCYNISLTVNGAGSFM